MFAYLCKIPGLLLLLGASKGCSSFHVTPLSRARDLAFTLRALKNNAEVQKERRARSTTILSATASEHESQKRTFEFVGQNRPDQSQSRVNRFNPNSQGRASSHSMKPCAGREEGSESIPIHVAEGCIAVKKPLNWTSSDVVSYVRGILYRDAINRGAKPAKARSKSKRKVKVGHGGTLDPLATGVLVLGIGSGTKQLETYLKGSKKYRAGVELGFETATLDLEGGREQALQNALKSGPWDHVTEEMIVNTIPKFVGTIMQKPPLFSAISKNGKRMYELGREGMTEDDVEIESREVCIYSMQNLKMLCLPCFSLDVECGGGTYIRSLVRDMGRALGTYATMTSLERTKQGQFGLEDALAKDDWTAENIYAALKRSYG